MSCGVTRWNTPEAGRLRLPTFEPSQTGAIICADDKHPGKVTTREHLMREWEIVQTAKEGFGDCHPLVWNPRPVNPQLG